MFIEHLLMALIVPKPYSRFYFCFIVFLFSVESHEFVVEYLNVLSSYMHKTCRNIFCSTLILSTAN